MVAGCQLQCGRPSIPYVWEERESIYSDDADICGILMDAENTSDTMDLSIQGGELCSWAPNVVFSTKQ